MPKHSTPRGNNRKWRSTLGWAVSATALLSLAVGHAATQPSAGAETDAAGATTQTYACQGRLAEARRSGASDLEITCHDGVDLIGDAETFRSSRTRTARTGLPAGTSPGDLIVATVHTRARTEVSMPGWTKAYDAVGSPRGMRLTAWWRVATGSDQPEARLSRRSWVSMTTTTAVGVDPTAPVAHAHAQANTSVAAPTASAERGLWLLSLGVHGRQTTASPPAGATSVAQVSFGRYRKTHLAVVDAGTSMPATLRWRAEGARDSVSGVLALSPATPAGPVPGAIAVVGGDTVKASCGGRRLHHEELDATLVSVRCDAGPTSDPTAPGSADPTSAPTTTPSTSEPDLPSTTGTRSSDTTSTSSTTTTPSTSVPVPSTSTTQPEPAASTGSPSASPSPASSSGSPGPAPGSATAVCGTAALSGPAGPPPGAIVVRPTDDLDALVDSRNGGSTYWLASGTHHLGAGQYSQVIPRTGDTFVGAPGAVLDGRHTNLYAFGGNAPGVSISHLTIQNFGAAGDNSDEGVVNHDAARGWTISHNTIRNNAGAGLMIGSDNTVTGNCLRDNGQYGFNAYHRNGVSNVVMKDNEITGNNTDDWEKRRPGCGCTGGGKFWETRGAFISGNYVHDNKGTGLWADSNNAGFVFEKNYIAGNDGPGIMYETSYNAVILNNTFVRNALVEGPSNPGFPTGAIYLSEAGSDSRVNTPHNDRTLVSGNSFVDNWAGVVAWENADRFAGSPANTSTGMTTLVNPSVATERACATSSLVATQPYFDDCRWKTKNLLVENNIFSVDPSKIANCTVDRSCGLNGLFSNYGSYPNWSPYKGDVVQQNITFRQNNLWRNNTYRGPWQFMVFDQGNVVPLSTWQAAPYHQDPGSVLQ